MQFMELPLFGVLQLLCSTTQGQCFIRNRHNSIKTREADKENLTKYWEALWAEKLNICLLNPVGVLVVVH